MYRHFALHFYSARRVLMSYRSNIAAKSLCYLERSVIQIDDRHQWGITGITDSSLIRNSVGSDFNESVIKGLTVVDETSGSRSYIVPSATHPKYTSIYLVSCLVFEIHYNLLRYEIQMKDILSEIVRYQILNTNIDRYTRYKIQDTIVFVFC